MIKLTFDSALLFQKFFQSEIVKIIHEECLKTEEFIALWEPHEPPAKFINYLNVVATRGLIIH